MTTGPAWEDPIVVDPDEATARAAADVRTERVEKGEHESEPLPGAPAAEQSALERLSVILADQIVARLGLFASRTGAR